MTEVQIFLLILAGFFAFIAQLSITAAYGLMPAQKISIFDYIQIVYSMLLAFIFFGEGPNMLSILAYILIFMFALANYFYTNKLDKNNFKKG